AVILKGGKEAFYSNICLANIMRDAIKKAGANPDAVILIEDTDRAVTTELMRLNDYLDVLIPRGSASLINAVVQNATVPVIETGVGNCHIFVDDTANLDMAAEIINNAKTSRPSVCNAAETLLVHKNIAKDFLPKAKALLDKSNCEIRGCEQTKSILGESVSIATEDDFATEFLDYILAVKVVDSVDEAIAHITKYSTHHSECIVTNNLANANKFTNMVDAAAVYVNASTRFTDGGEFGLGAEIGISTQKLHARGPMGLCELTTIKFVVSGDGQIR
ncbi:MAG: glutamate-5-semialdehyde dehydrogenase, partial [Oscillospiraceae bacterium]|nr:glutamate-5-semialdehyde dehydrogenase [Oscillospiraceae bacterium]